MTILQTLQTLNAYPVPPQVIEASAVRWQLDLTPEATTDLMQTDAYLLVKADVLEWLAAAPNITQGGQSYSLNDDTRTQYQQYARRLRNMVTVQPDGLDNGTIYGYKGSRL